MLILHGGVVLTQAIAAVMNVLSKPALEHLHPLWYAVSRPVRGKRVR